MHWKRPDNDNGNIRPIPTSRKAEEAPKKVTFALSIGRFSFFVPGESQEAERKVPQTIHLHTEICRTTAAGGSV